VRGASNVGGLIGSNNGFIDSTTNCYATGNVSGTGNNVGGLVGSNFSEFGGLNNSYATGPPT
jgi:hypothetical protein